PRVRVAPRAVDRQVRVENLGRILVDQKDAGGPVEGLAAGGRQADFLRERTRSPGWIVRGETRVRAVEIERDLDVRVEIRCRRAQHETLALPEDAHPVALGGAIDPRRDVL